MSEVTAERALDTAFAAACQNLAHVYGLRRLVEDKSPETPEEIRDVHTLLTASHMSSKELTACLERLKGTVRTEDTLDVPRSLMIADTIQVVLGEIQRHSKVVNACAEREKTNEKFQEMVKGMEG